MELVFASHNENKVSEVRNILPSNFKIISLNDLNFYDEIPENENTIEKNSIFKSNFIYEKFKLNVFADDTGLEIEALNNLPGVKSARYAGPEKNSSKNLNKVLDELKNNNTIVISKNDPLKIRYLLFLFVLLAGFWSYKNNRVYENILGHLHLPR